jgi:predicted metal-dependent peptidase
LEGESDGKGNVKVKAKEWFKDKEFDEHGWGQGDEGNQLEKMEALKDLVKRTMQKTSFTYGHAPEMIKDLLETLDKGIQKLNYKQILLNTLKKSLPSKDTEKTWVRPSRRYGDLAKGNKLGKMPRIDFYIDTSGSISIEEANELLAITNNFLTVGVEKAHVHLWADDIYLSKKIKRNFKLMPDEFKSGGTDLTGVMESIIKKKPDLAIILTDGFFGRPEVNYSKLKGTNLVFIITKQGTVDHPLKTLGKNVRY